MKKLAMIRKRHNQKEIPTPTKPRQKKKTKKKQLTITQLGTCTYAERTYRKPSEQLLSNRRPLSFHNLN